MINYHFMAKKAYEHARKYGISDESREIASRDSMVAVWYAKLDGYPTPTTRNGACQNPRTAYIYAVSIDKCPRDDTLLVACALPSYAYMYAEFAQQYNARTGATFDYGRALPSVCVTTGQELGMTRAGSYALKVMRTACDMTRAACCATAETAYMYATEVDKARTDMTATVVAGSDFEEAYINEFGSLY